MQNIYGILPILEALRAGRRTIERIVIARGVRTDRVREILETAKVSGIPVRWEPRQVLDKLSAGAHHQGAIAISSAARYADEEALFASVPENALYILLDGIEDPQNLGAIIRTAECAGVTAAFIPERRATHLTETVAKVSAGAIEHLPVARVTNLSTLIERLKTLGVWVAGLDQSGDVPYTEYDYSGKLALVLGGEGHGLHQLVRKNCDVILSIPMHGHISSLNVSVAAGVVLFEALRQRSRKG